MTNRIDIYQIKYDIKIIKYRNITKKERNEIKNLFKKCEKELYDEIPDFISENKFLGHPNPPFTTTIFLLYVNKKLVGFLAMSSLILRGKIFQKPLEKYLIENKKGAYLWWICGDNKYKHVSNPLFNVFNKYLSKNNYNYVLLVMEKEKIKNKNGLMKLYMNQKYKKIGFTTFINRFSKTDMIVMKKII